MSLPITLDEVHIEGVSPSAVEVQREPATTVYALAQGGRRLQAAIPPAGHPDLVVTQIFRLAYAHLREREGLVGWLLSRPIVHTLTLWRHERVSWAGDAVRSEWLLPWDQAPHVDPLPAADVTGETYRPMATLDPTDAAGLTVVEQDTATYDAGVPGAGELWVERAGRRLKMADPLAIGQTLYLAVVPRYRVLDASRDAQEIGRKTPRTLVLEETRS